jgi:hypothetical protein
VKGINDVVTLNKNLAHQLLEEGVLEYQNCEGLGQIEVVLVLNFKY